MAQPAAIDVLVGDLANEGRSDRDEITADVARVRRRGRILVDWGQNDRHRTIVSPYSLRSTHEPAVSTPLRWDEVEHAVASAIPRGSQVIRRPSSAASRVRMIRSLPC